MFFNQFWGATPGGAYGFGGMPSLGQQLAQLFASLPRMSNWMGNRWMDYSANWMGPGWWGQPQSYGTGWSRRCEHHCSHTPPPAPAPAPACATAAPAAPAAPVAPAVPAAPVPQAPVINAPREGKWDEKNGNYLVGQSGEFQVDYKYADRNTMVQYRTTGGAWTDLGGGKDMQGKSATIQAPPGSTVNLRVRNAGEYFTIGNTQNIDNKDHGQVTRTGNGYRVGIDDWKWDDGDYDDLILDLTDPKAKG